MITKYKPCVPGIEFSCYHGSWSMYYSGFDPVNGEEVEGYLDIGEEDYLRSLGCKNSEDLKDYFDHCARNQAQRILDGDCE